MTDRKITRRQIIKGAASVGALGALGLPVFASDGAGNEGESGGSAPFFVISSSTANTGGGSGFNHSMEYGWNSGVVGSGGWIRGKPSLYMGFEDNYYDFAGDHTYGMEWYVGYATPDGTTIRFGGLRPFYTRIHDSPSNTANKSVTTNFDIGTGPLSGFGVWASVLSGSPLFAILPTSLQSFRTHVFTPLNAGDNAIVIQPLKNQPGIIDFKINAIDHWTFKADSNNNLIFTDQVNARQQVLFFGGASIGASTASFNCQIIAASAMQRSRQTPTEAVLVSGVDATAGEHVEVTLSGARVVGAPLNPAIGQHLIFTFIQSGAGAFAVTWNAIFKKIWSDVGNAAGARSSIEFSYNGTNWNQVGGQALYV